MKPLYESIVNESKLKYNPNDYKKFKKDYEKFLEKIGDGEVEKNIQDALDQMAEWFKDIDKHKGLPMSYGRYEQFAYAFVTYNPSFRNGFGGLYDEKVTKYLIDVWEKATNYKIKNLYK